MINEYIVKLRLVYCVKIGMVDEIVFLYDLRGYIFVFVNVVY